MRPACTKQHNMLCPKRTAHTQPQLTETRTAVLVQGQNGSERDNDQSQGWRRA